MKLSRFVLVTILGGLFLSLWTTLHAQGTIDPKDTDQAVFSGGSATDSAVSAQPDPSAGTTAMMAGIGGDVPEGFVEMTSGAVKIEPKLEIRIQLSGYPQVDAQLRQIEQEANKTLEEITKKLNFVVENQLDPTLQLKKDDADALEATQRLKVGLEKQYEQAKKDIEQLIALARSKVPGAYAQCPVAPPTEPALCQSKQPGTMQSLDSEEKQVVKKVDYWVDRNKWAVDNPKGYESPDVTTNPGREWDTAIQDAKRSVERDSRDGESAANNVGRNFEEFKAKAIGSP